MCAKVRWHSAQARFAGCFARPALPCSPPALCSLGQVEELKKSSMKIGEAMYKNAGDGGGDAGGEQKADYEDVKKDGEGEKK